MLKGIKWDDQEEDAAVRAWLEKYTAYLVYRTNESHEDLLIVGLLNTTTEEIEEAAAGTVAVATAAASPPAPSKTIAATPFRRRLASTL